MRLSKMAVGAKPSIIAAGHVVGWFDPAELVRHRLPRETPRPTRIPTVRLPVKTQSSDVPIRMSARRADALEHIVGDMSLFDGASSSSTSWKPSTYRVERTCSRRLRDGRRREESDCAWNAWAADPSKRRHFRATSALHPSNSSRRNSRMKDSFHPPS